MRSRLMYFDPSEHPFDWRRSANNRNLWGQQKMPCDSPTRCGCWISRKLSCCPDVWPRLRKGTQSLGAFWNFDHCAQWRQGSWTSSLLNDLLGDVAQAHDLAECACQGTKTL